jgi:hypothetical protein
LPQENTALDLALARLAYVVAPLALAVRRVRAEGSEELRPPLQDTLRQLGDCNDMRLPLQVTFVDELGEDAGGLTVALFHGLFAALLDSDLFASHDPDDPRLRFVLPVPGLHRDEAKAKQLRVAGRLLAKMLHDGLHAAALARLPAFFFRYIWARVFAHRAAGSAAVTTRDYEQFVGWEVSRDKHQLLLASAEELRSVYCVPDTVTCLNVGEYLQTVRNDCVAGSRLSELELLVEGFQDPALFGTLKVLRRRQLTANELRHLLTGTPACLHRGRLARLLKFRGFGRCAHAKQQQEWVRQAVRSDLNNEELAAFLLYVAEDDAIPAVPPPDYLTVQRIRAPPSHLPRAHTCFYTLDLPPYPSREVFLQRLRTALAHAGQGYGIN